MATRTRGEAYDFELFEPKRKSEPQQQTNNIIRLPQEELERNRRPKHRSLKVLSMSVFLTCLLYTSKESVDEALKIFRLPSCSRRFPQDIGKGRPCLNYYIKQCSAPCQGKISQEDYNEAVKEAIDFLRGGSAECVRSLTKKMEEAAENLEFERAARIRDRLAAIKRMSDRQKVVALKVPEQDIIALAQGPEPVSYTHLDVYKRQASIFAVLII